MSLECQVNKKNQKAVWYKDNKEITPDDRFHMTTDNYRQILTISDITLDDEAEYKCVVKDVSTSATILVEGKYKYVKSKLFLILTNEVFSFKIFSSKGESEKTLTFS